MNEGTINAEVTMGGAVGVLLVNRYRVLKQLGQGGMGSVWLAEDTKLDGRKVAVKMLPSILVSNKRAYAQVKQEALVSLKLTHSNIVAVRAFEEEGGNPFLVMDYIEGRTLDDYLAEKGKLGEEETVGLLKPVAAALDYAHSQGVVHRDVKPGNVMIDGAGHPYVLDFGIAREVQETMTRVTGKLSSGTLMYMSPEQLHGAAPKSAQDVYSFAAMVYECLKGEPPFSRGQIEYQIEHDAPEPLSRHIAICRGVMAGLEKTPEARPSTCAAVLESGAKLQGADDGASARKTRIAAVLLGVLALGALVGGGWWLGRETGKSGGRVIEPEQAVNIEPIRTEARGGEPRAEKPLESATVREPKIDKEPKAGDTKTITLPGGATMEFCWCPATTSDEWKKISGGKDYFLMGSPPDEEGRAEDERQHKVILTQGFWMGRYEVTQAQWESVMGENHSEFKSSDRPVESVSWEKCQEFMCKINAMGQVSVGLPTEAQWEYACRAGTSSSLTNGRNLHIRGEHNGPELDELAWYGGNSTVGFELSDGVDCTEWKEKQYSGYLAGTHPVGQKKPNDWGLFDMLGNVGEWCVDLYDKRAYEILPKVNPCYEFDSAFRVVRGGGWDRGSRGSRIASRMQMFPNHCMSRSVGLRLICFERQRR